MRCLKPVLITKNLPIEKFPAGLYIPCGQCMNCRIQVRENWITRLLHESTAWDNCIFFTLTYDEEHIPENSSLKKSDLQKFFKRLRKNSGKKIKYFACGEYGEENGRPHYHCIVFGLDLLNKDDIDVIKSSWLNCNWDVMKKSSFGDVEYNSIRYVVGYVEKKITGKWQEYAYDKIEIPFHILSKGLGKTFASSITRDDFDKGYISVNGVRKNIPRYYKNIHEAISGKEIVIPDDYRIEKEKNITRSVLGIELDFESVYRALGKNEVVKLNEAVRSSNRQHDKNLKARSGLYKRNVGA